MRIPFTENEPQQWYSITEVSKIVGLPVYPIRKMMSEGRIPFLQIGRRQWVKLSDIQQLVEYEAKHNQELVKYGELDIIP